jgi:RND family efflux transporter MFP subunit
MRHTESNKSESEEMILVETNEGRLLKEIEDLKRQLIEQQNAQPGQHASHGSAKPPHPSRAALWMIAVLGTLAIAAAFVLGYLPRHSRQAQIESEAMARQQAVPAVSVVAAVPSPAKSELVLPGNIQALTEAPVLARADGYIKHRYADIGDRVVAGQLLADIDAPDLDQQVRQASATLQQALASLEQANSNYSQGKANEALAEVTARRWSHLVAKGAVSLQENDQYQAQYQAQVAGLQALEKAIAAAKANAAAAQANLGRLQELQGFEKVRAPFSGVITVRNVDVGTLITTGTTLLFRIAQTNILRTYVSVPQGNAPDIHAGQPAVLSIADLQGRKVPAKVTRVASALDPSSRTMLTEVQAMNPDGTLLPGMYALVDLNSIRKDPPLLIPGDALVVRADGTQAAVVGADHIVRYQKIDVGRDFGDRVEVLSGLQDGDMVVVNPSDDVRNGARVRPVPLAAKETPKAPRK